MILPNIIADSCPLPATPVCSSAVPSVLILKPGLATKCAPATLQFQAFLQSPTGEVELSSGVIYSSSNPAVVSVDASSGAATVLAEGVASVSAVWSGQTAFAQITVMGATNCCDDVCVQTIVLQDISQSMAGAWAGGGASSKADAARQVVEAFFGVLQTKDSAGLVSFNATATVLEALTGQQLDLENAEGMVPSPSGLTDIGGALDKAYALLSAAPLCGEGPTPDCAGLHGHGPPSSDLGVPGDTYVDDDTGALYWKAQAGWFP